MDFETLYKTHRNLVYNLALRYVHNTRDAEEIMQDVFMTVYDKWGTFAHRADIKTWLYRITINRSLDHLKAARRKKRWALFSLSGPETVPHIPRFDHPGVLLEQKQAVENIFRCIHALPDKQKTVVILLKIEGRTQAETAEIMKIGTKAVESLFQRAKTNLEKLLIQNEGTE